MTPETGQHVGWCYRCQSAQVVRVVLDPTGWQQFIECDCWCELWGWEINGLMVKVHHPTADVGACVEL